MRLILALLFLFATADFLSANPQNDENRPATVSEFLGINTYNIQFKPELFSPVFRHVRDYHAFDLDVGDDTSNPTTFPMARKHITWEDQSGKVGDFDGYFNWQEIYQSWIDHGFTTSASLMFVHMLPDDWTNLEEDAYNYGKAFASFFGPNGHNLIGSVELGNEPTPSWDEEDYARMFPHLARGLRDGDPDLKIVTPAVTAGQTNPHILPLQMFEDYTDLFDVIKMHVYSMDGPYPTQHRTWPESRSTDYLQTIRETKRWRDRHAPGKPIWIGEFGYDAARTPAGRSPRTGWENVTELVQAQWLVRSVFEFMNLGVERGYVFWFNDEDRHGYHGASGIMRFNEPKKSFFALRQLQESLGDYHFNHVIMRDSYELHIYEFVHKDDPEKLAWIAWEPTGKTQPRDVNPVQLRTMFFPGVIERAEGMATEDGPAPRHEFQQSSEGLVQAEIGESPVYFFGRRE